MTRADKRARDRHAASVRRWKDRLAQEAVAGERPANSIPRVNRKRKAKRAEAGEVYGPYHEHMATLPCVCARLGYCYGRVAGHHLKSVGAGGKDAGNEVPLCMTHHSEIHAIGKDAFERQNRTDLEAWAFFLFHDYLKAQEAA